MLFQVGGQGTRPTFFEMAAAQQLPASLRTALTYSFGVLALRRPFLHKILDYENESFALLMMVLETHSLQTTDASFSESLYGLRRRTVKFVPEKENFAMDPDQLRFSSLRRRQRILSVVFLVILPYVKSKLHSIYNEEREARLQAALWGNDDDAMIDESLYMPGQEGRVEVLDTEASSITRIKKKIVAIIAACYPFLHATNEGLSFAYQLLYLLDATGFYTPALHILGIHVCRVTGQELIDSSSRISKIRNNELERLRGPPWFKAVQRVLLNCIYFTLDHAQTGLIAAVFFFKMMEWWYQSAEERMSAPTVYPPPPPPPPPKVGSIFAWNLHLQILKAYHAFLMSHIFCLWLQRIFVICGDARCYAEDAIAGCRRWNPFAIRQDDLPSVFTEKGKSISGCSLWICLLLYLHF